MELRGSIALVTGVGRQEGIGAAVCRALAKEGVDIFYTYRSTYDQKLFPKRAAENPAIFAEELRKLGVRAASQEIDLSLPDAPKKLFAAAQAVLGTPHILINNACHDNAIPFSELTTEVLDQHYFVNVRAPALLSAEFVKHVGAGGGKIINMTSGQALGPMRPDQVAYTSTKAALEMLTVQLAPHLKEQNVTINALDPGPTDTGWMSEEHKLQLIKESPKGRLTTSTDVAEAIVSLLKNGANPTGQVMHLER